MTSKPDLVVGKPFVPDHPIFEARSRAAIDADARAAAAIIPDGAVPATFTTATDQRTVVGRIEFAPPLPRGQSFFTDEMLKAVADGVMPSELGPVAPNLTGASGESLAVGDYVRGGGREGFIVRFGRSTGGAAYAAITGAEQNTEWYLGVNELERCSPPRAQLRPAHRALDKLAIAAPGDDAKLRDHFAGQALLNGGPMVDLAPDELEQIAKVAYDVADAMLRERARRSAR